MNQYRFQIAYDVLNYNSEQTIEETDLVLRNAAEFGKVVSKDEEKRQSLFQKRFSLDGIANIMSKLDKKKGDAGARAWKPIKPSSLPSFR